jgi:putative transposase
MVPLEPDKYYHVYNHANGNEKIFREEKNYRFFLFKFQHHIVPIADVLAYCLIPNHFHFLLRTRSEREIRASELFQSSKTLEKFVSKENTSDQISYFYSKTFSNFFSSYTQSFNKLYKRKGSLLYKNFRRKEIDSDYYFQKLVNYIHFNPVIHGLIEQPSEWK